MLYWCLCAVVVKGDLNFIAIGDWGEESVGESAGAAGMEYIAENLDIQFVALLGDNFYKAGIPNDGTGDHSPRFQTTFENVYNGSRLQNIPFYVVAGNHDYKGNVTAQICYSADSSRWNFPSLWYSKTFPVTDTNKTFQIIFFDTVIDSGDSDGAAELWGQPPGTAHPTQQAAQWKWLLHELATSTADYLWVAGHYPVWSACSHGPTETLVWRLKPQLEKHGAHYVSLEARRARRKKHETWHTLRALVLARLPACPPRPRPRISPPPPPSTPLSRSSA
jgi:hypothetical protein